MLDNDDLREVLSECSKMGHNVRVKDIAFIILKQHFKDASTAYKCLYNDDDMKEYSKSSDLRYLEVYLNQNDMLSYFTEKEIMTAEENKVKMYELIERTEKQMEKKIISEEKGIQLISTILSKIHQYYERGDEEVKDQLVCVEQKFNDICPYCGHEISVPTKEDLMKKYNLIETDKI